MNGSRILHEHELFETKYRNIFGKEPKKEQWYIIRRRVLDKLNKKNSKKKSILGILKSLLNFRKLIYYRTEVK